MSHSSIFATNSTIGNQAYFAYNLSNLLHLTGFDFFLAIHSAKLQRNQLYNNWLAYRRKLSDIEDEYLFLSAEIEDRGSLEENAMAMASLAIEFGEISNIINDLDLELVELNEQINEAERRLANKNKIENSNVGITQ